MAEVSDNHYSKRFYTSQHIWIDITEYLDEITIGITEFYQDLLGDITHIHMPLLNRMYSANESLFVIESLKSATEFSLPLAGTVTRINPTLISTPNLLNHEPFSSGWICQLKIDEQVQLNEHSMSYADYEIMLDG